MRSRKRRETGEQDLFRSRLDQIIDTEHALVKLARTIDWRFLEERFGEVYADNPGQPPLPMRLMAGLSILKYTYDLSDELLCERWVENPYYQFFNGEEFFYHRMVFDRSSLTRWRNRMGKERLWALIQRACRPPPGPRRALGTVRGDRRFDSSARERDVPHRCEASEKAMLLKPRNHLAHWFSRSVTSNANRRWRNGAQSVSRAPVPTV